MNIDNVLYHLSCPSCGRDWWDKNAFPSCCPFCKTNRMTGHKGKEEKGLNGQIRTLKNNLTQ